MVIKGAREKRKRRGERGGEERERGGRGRRVLCTLALAPCQDLTWSASPEIWRIKSEVCPWKTASTTADGKGQLWPSW